jgi:hypothetical protein
MPALDCPPIQHADPFTPPTLSAEHVPLGQIGQGGGVVALGNKDVRGYRRHIIIVAAGKIDPATVAHVISARPLASTLS